MSENAVVYARYSSRGQQEQSIEGQVASARDYAERKGYNIIHLYADRAKTGMNDNREELQQMLADALKGEFTVVIVWKVDRFGRNREDITFNKYRLRKAGVRLECSAEAIPDGPEGVILESLFEGMAEYFSLQLSQNVRRGLMESAKKHHVIGGWVPLGYKTGPDRSYQVDEDGAKIVRMIFDMCADGKTLFEIMHYLNDHGYSTARGKPFAKSSLARLLRDERYIGTYTFKDVIRDEDAIPAIIGKDVFMEVQKMLDVNKRQPSSTWNYADYLLTGKLFCGLCGAPMVGKSGTGRHGTKYNYYACSERLHRKGCDKKPIRQDMIEEAVLTAIHNVVQDDALIKYIGDRVWELYQSEEPEDPTALLKSKLRETESSISRLIRSMELGAVSESIVARLNELEDRRTALKVSIAEAELTSPILTREMVQFFLERFRNVDFEDRDAQRRMVNTFVNSVFVYEDKISQTLNYSGVENKTVKLEDLEREKDTSEPSGSNVSHTAGQVGQYANPLIILSLSVVAFDIPLSRSYKAN